MSPIEKVLADVRHHYNIAVENGDDDCAKAYSAQLAALDALIAERGALRKALEPFAAASEKVCPEVCDSVGLHASSAAIRALEIGDLRRAHAALHGTAKQEPKHLPDCDSLDWNPDGIIKPCNCKAYQQPKPRTCGECKHRFMAGCPFPQISGTREESCGVFQPRDGAEKGGAR